MTIREAETTVVARATANLRPDFAGIFSPETVERLVAESYAAFARGARITGYLSILTERFARDRLRAAAQAEGSIMKDVPEVLFVCVHNAGRSQMAAALLDHLAAGRVHVRSAGSAPADVINPLVVEVLEELGLDVAKEYPKPLTDEFVRAADFVVTMGCGDACPVYPGKRYLDWDLEDPAGMRDIEDVRRIREEIRRRVQGLVDELLAAKAQGRGR